MSNQTVTQPGEEVTLTQAEHRLLDVAPCGPDCVAEYSHCQDCDLAEHKVWLGIVAARVAQAKAEWAAERDRLIAAHQKASRFADQNFTNWQAAVAERDIEAQRAIDAETSDEGWRAEAHRLRMALAGTGQEYAVEAREPADAEAEVVDLRLVAAAPTEEGDPVTLASLLRDAARTDTERPNWTKPKMPQIKPSRDGSS